MQYQMGESRNQKPNSDEDSNPISKMFTSESDKEEQVRDSDNEADFIQALNNSFDMSEELKKSYMNIDTLEDI